MPFTHSETFPIVAKAITAACEAHGKATREQTEELILDDAAGKRLVQEAKATYEKPKTEHEIARNMLAWFSAKFGSDYGPVDQFNSAFSRRKEDGKWVYFLGNTAPPTEQQAARRQLKQHVELIFSTLPVAAASAADAAKRLRYAGEVFNEEIGRVNTSDESQILDQIADSFAALSITLEAYETDSNSQEIIQDLRQQIEVKDQQIAQLVEQLAAQPSGRRQVLIAALGGASATAISGSMAYLFGPNGADMISTLWEIMTNQGTQPPPVLQLPPSTSV